MPTDRPTWGPPCNVTGGLSTVHLSTGASLTVATLLAPLVEGLAEETIRRGYPIRRADSGGYNCRRIGTGTSWSNHSWGLAVDLNWQTNPWTRPLTTDMPGWMVDLWTRYGFRWGGTYTGTPDAMHYEFLGTVADAAAHTEQFQNDHDGETMLTDEDKEWLTGEIGRQLVLQADALPALVWGHDIGTRASGPMPARRALRNTWRSVRRWLGPSGNPPDGPTRLARIEQTTTDTLDHYDNIVVAVIDDGPDDPEPEFRVSQ